MQCVLLKYSQLFILLYFLILFNFSNSYSCVQLSCYVFVFFFVLFETPLAAVANTV